MDPGAGAASHAVQVVANVLLALPASAAVAGTAFAPPDSSFAPTFARCAYASAASDSAVLSRSAALAVASRSGYHCSPKKDFHELQREICELELDLLQGCLPKAGAIR